MQVIIQLAEKILISPSQNANFLSISYYLKRIKSHNKSSLLFASFSRGVDVGNPGSGPAVPCTPVHTHPSISLLLHELQYGSRIKRMQFEYTFIMKCFYAIN